MKYLTILSILLTGCINSSTVFTNRSINYLSTPEVVQGSKVEQTTSEDAVIEANKEVKANAAQNLSDSSSNNQGK